MLRNDIPPREQKNAVDECFQMNRQACLVLFSNIIDHTLLYMGAEYIERFWLLVPETKLVPPVLRSHGVPLDGGRATLDTYVQV